MYEKAAFSDYSRKKVMLKATILKKSEVQTLIFLEKKIMTKEKNKSEINNFQIFFNFQFSP